MASVAQIRANRENAAKSTGPKSAEGKEASRRNALRHGLAAEKLVLPEEEAEVVAARIEAWTPSLKPRDAYDDWLVSEVVVSSVKIDRCRAHESALRTRQAARAAFCWEIDREIDAEDLGARLAKSPARVSRQLVGGKQGCAWMIARWEGLGRVLEAKGDWNEPQLRLALDLLGVPAELREGPTPLDGDRPALIRAQVAHLTALLAEALDALDEHDRSAAEIGLGRDFDKAIALNRRYEAACFRRMQWAQSQLKQGRAAAPASETPAECEPEEAEEPERAPQGFADDLSPIVPPSPPRIDAPMPPAKPANPRQGNRKARRAQKARARRG